MAEVIDLGLQDNQELLTTFDEVVGGASSPDELPVIADDERDPAESEVFGVGLMTGLVDKPEQARNFSLTRSGGAWGESE